MLIQRTHHTHGTQLTGRAAVHKAASHAAYATITPTHTGHGPGEVPAHRAHTFTPWPLATGLSRALPPLEHYPPLPQVASQAGASVSVRAGGQAGIRSHCTAATQQTHKHDGVQGSPASPMHSSHPPPLHAACGSVLLPVSSFIVSNRLAARGGLPNKAHSPDSRKSSRAAQPSQSNAPTGLLAAFAAVLSLGRSCDVGIRRGCTSTSPGCSSAVSGRRALA
jgi:hypothetical protein